MKTIEIKDNQTILDIAMQYYGNAEGISEILRDNPGIKNDAQAVVNTGRGLDGFYPDIRLPAGSTLSIDDESRTVRKTVVKKIDHDVTTYITEIWQEQLSR